MTDEEKIAEKAKLQYDFLHQSIKYAEGRENGYSSKFIDLEIQIASIILGVLGASALWGRNSVEGTWPVVVTVICLVSSLVFGLINIYILRSFWNKIMRSQRARFDIWSNYLLVDNGNFEQAKRDSDQIRLSASSIMESPLWPGIFQSLTLVVGILMLVGMRIFVSLN